MSSIVQLIALALWLGAAAFFSAAVAPALFAVLPSRSLAGLVVGRLLPVVLYAGVFVGLLVSITQVVSRGGWSYRGRETAAAVMVAACAVAQFVIAPRIERLRAQIPGPIEQLALDDARRVAFGRLHGVSVAWLGLAMIAAVVALLLTATDWPMHKV